MLQGIMVDFDFDSDLRLVATHRIEIFIYYVTLFKPSFFRKISIEPLKRPK